MNTHTLTSALTLSSEDGAGFDLALSIEGYWDEGRFEFDPLTGELDHSKELFRTLWTFKRKEMTALIDQIADGQRDEVGVTERLSRADYGQESREAL